MTLCGPFQPEPVCGSLWCYLLLVSGHEDRGFQTPAILLDVLVVFRVGSGRCEWTKDMCAGNLQVLHPYWPSPRESQSRILVVFSFLPVLGEKRRRSGITSAVLPSLQSLARFGISVIGTYLDLRY